MYYFISSLIILWFLLSFWRFPHAESVWRGQEGIRIFSNEGILLRELSNPKTPLRHFRPLSEFPSELQSMILWSEDRRFFSHPGVDPIAIIRSLLLNLSKQEVISGASTITQQLVRTVYSSSLSSFAMLRKIEEALLAIRTELFVSKQTILEHYFNRVPMPAHRTGLYAAALHHFQKEPRYLSEAEMLTLLLFVRHGSLKEEYFSKKWQRLHQRWNHFHTKGDQKQNSDNVALFSLRKQLYPLNKNSQEPSPEQMHFTTWLRQHFPSLQGDLKTSISAELNSDIVQIIQNELEFLRQHEVTNSAVVVLKREQDDNSQQRLRLIAMVGSQNFQEPESGQVNGAIALRNGGSALKPFLYALAMDQHDWRPYHVISDEEVSIPLQNGEYFIPRNNDMRFWGKMTLHEALANSRNIPAIRLLDAIGVQNFYNHLKELGFQHLRQDASYYGAGLALGVGQVTLLDLTWNYSLFLLKGEKLPLFIGSQGQKSFSLGKARRFYTNETSLKLQYILSNPSVRRSAFGQRNFLDFPFDVAAKTGTSKDNIDGWSVGYSRHYIIGVWVGNFSGKPMRDVSGHWGAGRIFHQVMRRLIRGRPRFEYPDHWQMHNLCLKDGVPEQNGCHSYTELLTPEEWNRIQSGQIRLPKIAPGSLLSFPERHQDEVQILSPRPGAIYTLDPGLSIENQEIVLAFGKVHGNRRFHYRINQEAWQIVRPGFKKTAKLPAGSHSIEVADENGLLQQRILFHIR